MLSRMLLVALGLAFVTSAAYGLERCPYLRGKQVIKAAAATGSSAPLQMLAIRNTLEKLTEAYWGVVIVEDDGSINDQVQWSIPNIWEINGDDAFCMTVVNGWQYNVFMIYDKERMTSRSRRHAQTVPAFNQDVNLNTFGADDSYE